MLSKRHVERMIQELQTIFDPVFVAHLADKSQAEPPAGTSDHEHAGVVDSHFRSGVFAWTTVNFTYTRPLNRLLLDQVARWLDNLLCVPGECP